MLSFARVTLFTIFLGLSIVLPGQSYEEASKTKSAALNMAWYTSIPFIYEDANGDLRGIEYELVNLFAEYLLDQEGISLTINWEEAPNFLAVLERTMQSAVHRNFFGTSAISITRDRSKFAQFTDPYLPDITVLVSSQGTPIVNSYEDLNELIRNLTAVTITGTTYEKLLLDLQDQLNLELDMMYIESDQNVLERIGQAPDRFGFIDLPIYLMLIKNGGNLTRQNFFTARGIGYSVIMPKGTDWEKPFNRFLSDTTYAEKISGMISRHLGPELFEFIDQINARDQLGTSILTKEKELQLALIKNANLELQQARAFRYLLTGGISLAVILVGVIGLFFFRTRRATRMLLAQNNKIERQGEDIQLMNEQLVNRNAQLIAINEEKNNLFGILAHDLRSPLGQIMMLADVLKKPQQHGVEDSEALASQVSANADRMNHMITKILETESLEGGQIRIFKEPVDVSKTMNELVRRYQPAAQKKQINFLIENCEKPYLKTDHLLLFLVLENLVSNAIKFSGPNSTIKLRLECLPDSLIIIVADEGPGFTSEDRKKIFNRFEKLSARPTGGEPSVGLGLSICKKYVKDLGGKIQLQTEVGKGSTFSIVLPLV